MVAVDFVDNTDVIPTLDDCPAFDGKPKEGDVINPGESPKPAPAKAVSNIEAGGLFTVPSPPSNDKLSNFPLDFIFFFRGFEGSDLVWLIARKSSAVRSL